MVEKKKVRITKKLIRASPDVSLGMTLGSFGSENDEKHGGLTVVNVYFQSPAYKAKIQKGWVLIKVNGISVKGYTMQTINSLFKVSNTEVVITFDVPEGEDTNPKPAKKQRVQAATKTLSPNTVQSTPRPQQASISTFFPQNMSAPCKNPNLTDTNKRTMETLTKMYRYYKNDTIKAVLECGDDVERCREFIEEKKFQEDMNRAQILSEDQRRKEEELASVKTSQELKTSTNISAKFPKSSLLDHTIQTAALTQIVAHINTLEPETPLRERFIELLELEHKIIGWYGLPAKCFYEKTAKELDTFLTSHQNACSCKEKVECEFVTHLSALIGTIKEHAFGMPDVEGGVPRIFLNAADEMLQFNVDEDGFEIVVANN